MFACGGGNSNYELSLEDIVAAMNEEADEEFHVELNGNTVYMVNEVQQENWENLKQRFGMFEDVGFSNLLSVEGAAEVFEDIYKKNGKIVLRGLNKQTGEYIDIDIPYEKILAITGNK